VKPVRYLIGADTSPLTAIMVSTWIRYSIPIHILPAYF